MKRFFKLFMAVAAVAGVTACTTDATEDLGVKVGGQTTLTLSLDDTRTQLGVKGEDETTYPLTWAAGDAISVNGSVSNALKANEAGAATATFTFNNGFGSAPYFVAYPATSTNNQVVFAAEQTHTSNTTFGNNAAVMYGYTTDLNNVKLNHLTGVLKIGVVSDNEETLKSVRISTVDRKPIAGTFSVDAEGKLTPVNTTDVITYTFSEGVDLKSEPTYIHVAVPAGVYGELYVTLEAETEKAMDDIGMNIQKTTAYSYKTVTTDNTKPVNAGTVREFSNNLTFEPADEETNYVIATYDDLKKFKTAVEGGDTRNAVLVNDIEVGDDWASIEAATYTATFNGNGYAIKGLKAPLFNATAATIKGVHLKGVNITSAATANLGALVNTYTGTSITHCSTEGIMDITFEVADTRSVSGIVGYVGADITLSDLVNKVNITIDGRLGKTLNVGGIFGQNDNNNDITAKNLANEGALKVAGTQEVIVTIGKNLNLGGIAGYTYGQIKAAGETLTNSGSIEVQNIDVTSNANIGGTFGRVNKAATVKSLVNSGSITLSNVKVTSNIYLGGVAGQSTQNLTADSLTNSGAIEITNSAEIPATVFMGGTIGNIGAAATVGALTNETTGTLKINNTTIKGKLNFGGIIGLISVKSTLSNLHNKGAVTFDTITVTSSYFNVGGIYGYNAQADTTLNTLTNEGNINISNTTIDSNTDVGGLIGTATANTILKGKLENKGNITCYNVTVTSDQPAGIGGIVGLDYDLRETNTSRKSDLYTTTDVTSIVNSGDVKCIGGSYKHYLGVAGIYGLNKNDAFVKNATNTGDVICASTAKTGCYVGGLTTAAQAAPAVESSKSYGHVAAFIWDGTEAGALTVNSNAGMLTSAAADTASLKDCQVGGWLGTSAVVTKDAQGKLDVEVIYDTELSGTNYLTHMYSTEATEANGCIYWNGK